MLQKLPVELLEAIINHLPSKQDRRSLWAVSRIFRGLLASRVFETLTIRAKERAKLQLDSRPYFSLDAAQPLDCLKLIRHLHLRAPFRKNLEVYRCPHYHDYGFRHLSLTSLHSNVATPRILKLIPLLSQLQENGLVSFSWDLGMCIPGHILGREGYLTKKQTAIESLSLITTPCPDWYLEDVVIDPVVLSNFPQLRKFSWKGLRTTGQLNSLRDLFASNYEVLEDLELDFNDWNRVRINGTLPNGFGLEDYSLPSFQSHILPHKSNKDLEPFRSLKRLALSAFDLSAFEFDEPAWGFTHSFNILCLQVLKLHCCIGTVEFLFTILEAGLVLKLKSLELIIQDGGVERNGFRQSALIGFLESFQGLEDLYIMIELKESAPEYWASYWNAILHHSSTLKRLIYHQRKYVTWWSTDLPDEDFIDAGFAPPSNPGSEDEDLDDWNDFIYNRPLAQMQLECFGIADDVITALVTMLDPLSAEKNFKLLHIRRTATDPSRFQCADDVRFEDQVRALVKHNPSSWSPDDYSDNVRWGHSLFLTALEVFRSPKFDNLQILAFGDFSHGCRYKWASLLLCRAVTPNPEVNFRVMLPDDIASYKRSGVLNVDFLTACPRNGLFSRGSGGDFL
ncbi:MAG: hypothetical protein Q9161_004335 [Pseudevernia consocians]